MGRARDRPDGAEPADRGHGHHAVAGDHRVGPGVRTGPRRPAGHGAGGDVRRLRLPGPGRDEEVRTRAHRHRRPRPLGTLPRAAGALPDARRAGRVDRPGAGGHRCRQRRARAAHQGVVRRSHRPVDLVVPAADADRSVRGTPPGRARRRGSGLAGLGGDLGSPGRGGCGGLVRARGQAARRPPRAGRGRDVHRPAEGRSVVDGLGAGGPLRDDVDVQLQHHHVGAGGAHRRRWQCVARRDDGRPLLGVGSARSPGGPAGRHPDAQPVRGRRGVLGRPGPRLRRPGRLAARRHRAVGVRAGHRREHVPALHDAHQPPDADPAVRLDRVGLRPGHRLRAGLPGADRPRPAPRGDGVVDDATRRARRHCRPRGARRLVRLPAAVRRGRRARVAG